MPEIANAFRRVWRATLRSVEIGLHPVRACDLATRDDSGALPGGALGGTSRVRQGNQVVVKAARGERSSIGSFIERHPERGVAQSESEIAKQSIGPVVRQWSPGERARFGAATV